MSFKKDFYREYCSHKSMKGRCLNKNNPAYKNYGGRGITIDERWLGRDGFKHFLEDMGRRPDGYTLDRIDNDGPYSPENCRWTDYATQNRNRRSNPKIKYMNREMTLKEWAEELNLSYGALVMRHSRYGWTGEKLFSKVRKYTLK